MASSTVTRSSTELTDDVDETPLDDEDFDLDDEGDDDADYDDEEYDDSDDEDSSDEEEDQDDDSEAQAVQEDDGPAPELRDYYLDVSLEENGDGSKRSPFNNPASLKGVRLAPGGDSLRALAHGRGEPGDLRPRHPGGAHHAGPLRPRTGAPLRHRRLRPHGGARLPAQNGYIFRGWVIKGIKMQPSIAA